MVPAYNVVSSGFYKRNINSIYGQNYSNFHVVFVDDHSSDESGKWIEKYIE